MRLKRIFFGQYETNCDVQLRELGVCVLMNTVFWDLSVNCSVPLTHNIKISGARSSERNICQSTVLNFLHVAILVPRICRWLIYF